ncbi:transporter [Marinobacter sp. 71-i]|uniref:Transporter n=1 Tax=Marinobacter iranensis TaxID=2962607 RepID=A0ABT5YBF3_9GAMM|nr:hypothetical protein [Marinobacter iranensis]MDF0751011.1 transporter [Marinobacter iranensis]
MHRRLSFTAVLAVCLMPFSVLNAQTDLIPPEQTDTLRRVIEQQNRLIEQLNRKILLLEQRVSDIEQSRPDAAVGQSDGTPAQAPPLPELSQEEQREQERLVRTAFQQTLIERSGLLLPPGTVDVEPSLSYAHSSADNIVIDGFTILPVLVVGDIVSERVKRNQTTAALTTRIGLPWDSQLDVRIPYGYSEERRFSADNEETISSADGLGDISLGISHQLLYGEGSWPDILASLRWKSTSGRSPFDVTERNPIALGSGYDSINLGLTGVKVVDPLVYFGGANYSWNLSTREDAGRFEPGNSIGFSLGTAIALNLTSSLSFAYDQQFTERSRLDGEAVPGSYLTTGTFSVGGSFAISNSQTADISLGIGVTEDSPDVQIGASMPLRFRWWGEGDH